MTTEVKTFFNTWSIYDIVLENNYMFHQEIYQGVKEFLTHRYYGHPFTLLDLGCGSAQHLAPILASLPISRYIGYDLSDIALGYAKQNLASLNCPLEFHQNNLIQGVENSTEKVDVIFSSFALHHLSLEEKANFFELAYKKLNDKGVLLLIDVMREDSEDRELYIERYCNWLTAEWTIMSLEQRQSVCKHISTNDLPESLSTLATLGTQAGFQDYCEMNRFNWHHSWYFEK